MPTLGGVNVPERAVMREPGSNRIIKLRLQPAQAGTVVRDNETGRLLGATGALVPNNSYWRRRLSDGSAVAAPEPPKSKQKDEESSE